MPDGTVPCARLPLFQPAKPGGRPVRTSAAAGTLGWDVCKEPWLSSERRQHHRSAQPFEGTWHGASGSSHCRIADISLGGCFIQGLAMPAVGETTVVSVKIGGHSLSFSGKIIYVDVGMGFAVQFQEIPREEIEELGRLLAALQTDRAGA